MKNNVQTIDDVKADITTLVDAMKSVDNFDPSGKKSPMPGLLDDFSDALEAHVTQHNAHSNEQALEAGRKVLDAGRNILGAFLRGSVIDKMIDADHSQKAYFTAQIAILRDVEKFDPDIIAGLEQKKAAVVEALKVEKNGTFQVRITAYNAMNRALAEAEAEQTRRERQPAIDRANAKKAKWAQQDAEATARNKARDESERQKLLAGRLEEAKKFRNLL